MNDYRLNSIIRYRPLGGGGRLCRVIARFVENGAPGFDALEVRQVGEGFVAYKTEKPLCGCWGYDDQITEVVRF